MRIKNSRAFSVEWKETNMKMSMLLLVSVLLLFASSSDCAIRFNTDSKLKSSKFKIHYFKQMLDHYSLEPLGYKTFNQRVFIDDSRWSHSAQNNISRPIVAYLGAEAPAEDQLFDSFIYSIADHFNALFVFIEHRYYGESMPFGSVEAALQNTTTRAFLTVPQALHDYATVIVDVKRKYSAQQSPVIVIGGSYGGELSTFFRLKYPHIATAALSSSAPILYDTRTSSVNNFYEIVTKDYKDAGCDKYIKKSWDELYKEASKPSGLKNLEKLFGLPELSSYSDFEQGLIMYYTLQAQNNYPKVQEICKIITTTKSETKLVKRIASAVTDLNETVFQADTPAGRSYNFETSTQMLQRFNRNPKTTMFPPFQYSFKDDEKDCLSSYGVEPTPELLGIEFGFMSDIKIMKDIGSNIIFSNGLRDPFSVGGILESISETLVALTSKDATHCMDLDLPSPSDPESLKQMRDKELQILKKWIDAYYSNA